MNYEVKIILYPEVHKSKNGAFFENLVRPIFENEGYKIEMNVNFTGLEIDLFGKHKNRDEKLLVECKAKDKVNSDEIKKFYYNLLVSRKADYGYFLYTHELDHQAAGLKAEHEERDKRNSTFFGPEKIINALVDINKIRHFNAASIPIGSIVEKLILAYTYFGNYYIAISMSSAEQKHFHVFDAITLNSIEVKDEVNGIKIIDSLIKEITEVGDYKYFAIPSIKTQVTSNSNKPYLNFSSEFSNYLNSTGSTFSHPQVDVVLLDDLFVIPNLSSFDFKTKSKNRFEKVNSLDKVFNSEDLTNKVALIGSSVSGKTTCCKYIIKDVFHKNLFPILLKGNEINGAIRIEAIHSKLEQAYSKQFDTNISFESINKKHIYVIIDDFHLLLGAKNRIINRLLKNLESVYYNIIITGDESALLRSSLNDKNDRLDIFDYFKIFRILELGPKLRHELIENWYKLGILSTNYIDKNDHYFKIDKALKHVNMIIGRNYAPSYPFYILAALQALETGNSENTNYSIYGFYYELLIKSAIGRTIKDKREYSLYINYLSNFAYYLFEQSEKEISRTEYIDFHSSFCKKIDYTFSHVDALMILDESKILTINNSNIGFREKYVYYFFVANFLSSRLSKASNSSLKEINAKKVVSKLIHRVYRNEYANIVMFLTHLSKDSYIMDTLMGAAKSIFEETPPTKLDNDVLKINEMIKALPEQVIEEFDVEQKREEALEANEQSEIEADSELELEELEDTNASLDEDISAIDYFAKLNLAFKTLDLLGQLAKAYWGELDADEKSEIVLETYNLGLRTLTSCLNLLQNSSREIVDYILKLVEEKHIKDRHILKKTVEEDVMNFIFNTSFLTVWGVTKRISNAVGTDKLKKTYSNILNEHPFVSYKLINLSIELDHNTKIPFEEVKKYSKDFNKNNLAKVVLQNLIINHLYLFETGFKEKQKICSMLGIKIHDQRLIDNMSQRKKQPKKMN